LQVAQKKRKAIMVQQAYHPKLYGHAMFTHYEHGKSKLARPLPCHP